jgi:hypothetical protein
MIKMNSRISLVYDRILYDSPIPNGVSWSVIKNIFKNYGEIDFLNEYVNKHTELYNVPPSVNNSFLSSEVFGNINFKNSNQIIFDYIAERLNYEFIYPIESFSRFFTCLGYESDVQLTDLLNGIIEDEKSFFNFINEDILKIIKEKKGYILLNHAHEGDANKLDILLIKKLLNKYGIPKDRFIYVYNSFDLEGINFKNYNFQWHLARKSTETLKLYESQLLNENNIFQKQNKFNYPIRRFRGHRMELLEKLWYYDKNFINENLVSYDIDVENNKGALRNFTKEFVDFIKESKRKVIDTEDMESVQGYRTENKWVYEQSYFSIVAETMFYENYNYVSEKTYKPIAHQHPFILLGRANTLKFLKQLGFKTFSPFIDESYDSEMDDKKRFEMIYNEIIRLNSLSNEECDEILKSLNDILIFNQTHLIEINRDLKYEYKFGNYIHSLLFPKRNELI